MSARDVNVAPVESVDLDALADALADRIAPRRPALVNAAAAGEHLGVPASWLMAEARADRVPHRRLGKYVRFNLADLDAWAEARARGPKVAR